MDNARLLDELLDGEIFYSLKEAQIVIGERTPGIAPPLANLLGRSMRSLRASTCSLVSSVVRTDIRR